MTEVTDADRKAAEELRVLLADLSGFWHRAGDDGPLCQALARHREKSELQLLDRMSVSGVRAATNDVLAVAPLPRPRKRRIADALAG